MRKSGAIIVFTDIISFWVAFFLLIFIRFSPSQYLEAIHIHHIPFSIIFLSWIFIFYIFGLYNIFFIRPTALNLRRFFTSIILAFLVGIIFFYFVPIFGVTPKINLVILILLFGFFSFYFRLLIYRKTLLIIHKPIVFIGTNKYLQELINILRLNPQLGFEIIGNYKNIDEISQEKISIDNLIIVFDKIPEITDEDIARICENKSEIIDTVEAYEKLLQKIPIDLVKQDWIVNNINIKKEKNILYSLITRISEIISAIFVLIISSPLIGIASLARLIEDGRPIFLKQKRVGKNGKVFEIYKIRSMVALCKDGSAEKDGPVWSTGKDDPRITKVGKVIRKLHIDEIIQMINVLRGDMALVGPRPERPIFVEELEKTIPHYTLRHIIKPGFTGWAQIKYRYARSIEDSKEKFEYDLYYIKNRNLFLDIEIILKTIRIILTH